MVTISALTVGSTDITASVAGFSSTFTVDVTQAPVTSISFDVTSVTLPEGQSQVVSVIATHSDNSTSNVTATTAFSVSSADLGAFAAPGATTVSLTAANVGTGTITASISEFTAEIPFEVVAAVATAILSGDADLSVPAGLQTDASITVEFSDSTVITPSAGVTWSVADSAIATVSSSSSDTATINGLTVGTTTVTAAFDSLSFNFDITVTDAQPVSVDFTLPTLYEGDANVQLSATATYTDSSTGDVTGQVVWSSSDDAIATVSNDAATAGVLNVIDEGSVSITATFANSAITTTETTTVLQPRIVTGFSSYTYNSAEPIVIGEGDYALSIDFGEVDDQTVTLEAVGVNLLASAGAITGIEQVTNTNAYTYAASAVSLTQNTNQAFGIVSGANNVKAVIQVHEVERFADGANTNLVIFSWAIMTDGGVSFADYSVQNRLAAFSCRTLSKICTEFNFSYDASTSASRTTAAPAEGHELGRFILVSLGQEYTVTNLVASESTNAITPTISGLSNNLDIPAGHGVAFKLLSPSTNGQTLDLTYSFNIDDDPAKFFRTLVTFTAN
jgi:hypothetical protein